MSDILYIIGNGFDLHHRLNTSYTNFRQYCVCKKTRLWNLLESIYGPKINEDLWWKDFEKMLGEVDYEHLTKSYNGEALGGSKIRNLLKGFLPPLFREWVKGINHIAEKDVALKIDTNALFFTFNYTLLLEQTYNVKDSNVWHIHKSIKDVDNIIIGHDLSYIDLSQNVNHNLQIRQDILDGINQEIINGAKKVRDRILLNEEGFSNYAEIKHIVAIGFSFNDIDMPYIEKIWGVSRHKQEIDWTLYWHAKGEDTYMKEKLIKLGINETSIKTKFL